MKKGILSLGLAAALLIGTASAYSPVQIDDSGFNYFEAEDGYTSLDYENGSLTLVVTDAITDANLKISGVDALPLDSADSDEYNTQQLQALIPVSDELTGVSVEHSDSRLTTIVNSYDQLFQAEGFSGNLEQSYANGQVVVYENDGVIARVIFTQQGEDVTVYLTTL